MQTIVINNKEGLIIGQMPHLSPDKGGTPRLGEQITLLPGANLVKNEVLKALRGSEAFDKLFKTKIEASPAPEQNPEKVGKFVLVAAGEVEDSSPLLKMKNQAAEALIDETLHVDLLKKWLIEETRGEIRRVIQNKIDKLLGSPTGVPGA